MHTTKRSRGRGEKPDGYAVEATQFMSLAKGPSARRTRARGTCCFRLAVLILVLLSSQSPAQAQPPTGSVSINPNAPYARFSGVILTLSASDAVGVIGYYVSTSPSPPAAAALGWVGVPQELNFAVTIPFTLSIGDGTKTLYAWYKNAIGNVSTTASASILLDQTAPANGSATSTVGSSQVTVSWSGFADTGSEIGRASCRLGLRTAAMPASACTTGALLLSGSATSFTHTGLT